MSFLTTLDGDSKQETDLINHLQKQVELEEKAKKISESLAKKYEDVLKNGNWEDVDQEMTINSDHVVLLKK